MELFLYLIPNTSRKQTTSRAKPIWVEPVKVQIGDAMVWIWKLPFSPEIIEEIQKSIWKRRLFFVWLDQFFRGKGLKKLCNQMKQKIKEGRFGEYFESPDSLRVLYLLFYLSQKYEWKKETKWFISCGDLLDGSELLDFLSCFLEQANCVFLYQTTLTQFELEDLWQESGLAFIKTRELENIAECDLVLDCSSTFQIPKRYLSHAMTYLDLGEQTDKRRLLQAKCGKISYISLRNYLDRAFQSTV